MTHVIFQMNGYTRSVSFSNRCVLFRCSAFGVRFVFTPPPLMSVSCFCISSCSVESSALWILLKHFFFFCWNSSHFHLYSASAAIFLQTRIKRKWPQLKSRKLLLSSHVCGVLSEPFSISLLLVREWVLFWQKKTHNPIKIQDFRLL